MTLPNTPFPPNEQASLKHNGCPRREPRAHTRLREAPSSNSCVSPRWESPRTRCTHRYRSECRALSWCLWLSLFLKKQKQKDQQQQKKNSAAGPRSVFPWHIRANQYPRAAAPRAAAPCARRAARPLPHPPHSRPRAPAQLHYLPSARASGPGNNFPKPKEPKRGACTQPRARGDSGCPGVPTCLCCFPAVSSRRRVHAHARPTAAARSRPTPLGPRRAPHARGSSSPSARLAAAPRVPIPARPPARERAGRNFTAGARPGAQRPLPRTRAHGRHAADTQPARGRPSSPARACPPRSPRLPARPPARRKFVPRRRGLRGGRIARGEAPRGGKSGESAERSNSRSTRGRKSGRARRRDAARLTVPGGRANR
ncbi:uncharacterized protein LOC143273213 [Peromyscus maniculatus bairdii]|uniref:uncharacterized protein LOC143273213 n=1 Tax=Peromyscus maniculatus bairdii TaxID=230844 RepID=UPI003FD1FFCD